MSTIRRPPQFLNLEPHNGSTMDLVIGIDVGTTFSGVSYAVLQPNKIPEVQPVAKFSGQVTGDAKIPSIMYFDKNSKLKAAGASAVTETVLQDALFEGWTKVEHFKMHLRPADMRINTNGLALGTLPPSMTATEAMGHFLRYLYNETIEFIKVYHTDGPDLFRKVEDRITFVLSHPNGWAGLPQQHMRQAAVLGGLIKDSAAGHAKLKFVTEGEASALACLANGLCPPNLQPGYWFMIADAGGGTLDMTSYEIIQTSPLRLRELTSSDCRFAGSVFVNQRARRLLQQKLRGTHYDNADELDDLANKVFEGSTKREFDDSTRATWMRIGERSENDAERGIRKGALRLEGTELERCFEFSISELLKSIRSQIAACGVKSTPVWLVGGFGASPWLLKKLHEELKNDGVAVNRPDTNLAKAVANGDVLYSLDNTIISRVTRATYGVECNTPYQPFDAEHARRKHLLSTLLNGNSVIPSKFDVIVKKGTEVQETEEFTSSYFRLVQTSKKASFKQTLLCYNGQSTVPMWYDENKEMFRHVCSIEADLSNLCRPSLVHSYEGKTFWRIDFDIEILFGQTELKARVKWIEDGAVRYGPATIFYEDD